jgi:tetratricopeptide (TPR) repeat protein
MKQKKPSANALIRSALEHHRAGRLVESKTLYEQALALEPRHPDALHLAGVVALQGGDAQRGLSLIQQAIEIRPDNPGFHANLGQALLALRRIDVARAAFLRAAALDPGTPQFGVAAASCLAMQGSLEQAGRELRAATQRHPGYALAWYNLGNVLQEQERHEESLEYFSRAIQLDPALPDAHNNLGRALHRLERFEAAEQAYRRCLALRPDYALGNFNLASVLMDRGRFAEAVAVCRQALERAPRDAELRLKLGSAHTHLGEMTAALEAFRAAADAAPANPRALWAYGYALIRTGSEEEGIRWLERAWALQPESQTFRAALSTLYLSLGNLKAGWALHEWRPARVSFLARNPDLRLVTALPDHLPGLKICLLREQGLGDELFFLRFAAALKSRGAEITCRVSARLASMLERVPALGQIVAADDAMPEAGLYLLMGDLPQALGATDFPPPVELAPRPGMLESMKERLAALGPPPYVGVTWRAGIAPEQQRGTEWVLHKAVPLESLCGALRNVKGTLIALQRNPEGGEVERLAALAGRPVHDLTALNEDLEGMLALLAIVDDYIGVSNTNMHLRAGVGRSARVLVPCPPEWRWMATGEASPWFPGFRVYRQRPDGDWNDALARLASDLLATTGSTR